MKYAVYRCCSTLAALSFIYLRFIHISHTSCHAMDPVICSTMPARANTRAATKCFAILFCHSISFACASTPLYIYCQTMSIICYHIDVNKHRLMFSHPVASLCLSSSTAAAATLARSLSISAKYDLQIKKKLFLHPFSFLSKDKLLL